jgi:protein SCO1/2
MARLFLLAACVLALAASAIGVVLARSGHTANRSADGLAIRLAGTDVWPVGARPAPAFAARDQNGRMITRNSLHGRIWAITFLDSRCRQACPVVARDLATTQRLLDHKDPLVIVLVSVLPDYDTPARVRAFAREAGLTDNWHWLLGTKEQLAPIWKDYGIYVVSGVEHTAALYLVDRRGDVRVADGVPFVPSQLAGSTRALMASDVHS